VSYNSIAEMASSTSLVNRISAAAAEQRIDNPSGWAGIHIWEIVSSPNWGAQWDYAKDTWQINANPDFGARTDVISDGDILAAVQAVIAAP
jgi:hypothetical protein